MADQRVMLDASDSLQRVSRLGLAAPDATADERETHRRWATTNRPASRLDALMTTQKFN